MQASSLYQRQLAFVFERPVTEPAWYWQITETADVPFDEAPLTAFEFIENLLRQPGRDLAAFTDAQTAMGLNYIFNNSCSNLACDFQIAPVTAARKAAALRSLSALFEQVFAERCQPLLSSGAQAMHSKINNICYVFWDECPLSTWMKNPHHEAVMLMAMDCLLTDDSNTPREILDAVRADLEAKGTQKIDPEALFLALEQADGDADIASYYQAIVSVMERSLYLNNPACVESGLHGLGELVTFQPKLAQPVIDRFLQKAGRKHSAQLINYAHAAYTGMIL